MSQNQSKKKYIVTTVGPINISGVLRWKDDTVFLNAVEAHSYAAHIKTPKVKRGPKDQDKNKA